MNLLFAIGLMCFVSFGGMEAASTNKSKGRVTKINSKPTKSKTTLRQEVTETKGVVILDTGDSEVTGTLELSQADPTAPVIITGTLTNLTPGGKHGFHIHQLGDLREGCASTKGHFNPTGGSHGVHPADVHAGDLGNIQADDDGVAVIDISDSQISFTGETSILGRAVVVHELEDDLGEGGDEGSLTTGNAGPRLKCGNIALA